MNIYIYTVINFIFLHCSKAEIWTPHLKFEYIVVYENILDEFDTGHCPKFYPFTKIQTGESYISGLANGKKY